MKKRNVLLISMMILVLGLVGCNGNSNSTEEETTTEVIEKVESTVVEESSTEETTNVIETSVSPELIDTTAQVTDNGMKVAYSIDMFDAKIASLQQVEGGTAFNLVLQDSEDVSYGFIITESNSLYRVVKTLEEGQYVTVSVDKYHNITAIDLISEEEN